LYRQQHAFHYHCRNNIHQDSLTTFFLVCCSYYDNRQISTWNVVSKSVTDLTQ